MKIYILFKYVSFYTSCRNRIIM